MHQSLPPLAVITQFPAPEPLPQSLAYDGKQLWIGSFETKNIIAVDRMGRRRSHFRAPHKPIGSAFVNGHLHFVLADEQDDRTLRTVDEHGHWSDETYGLPDESGSFLSWDGEWLWLSQRMLKRVHRLDPHTHAPVQTIAIGEQILGQTWVGEWLYLSLWLGKERGGAVLARTTRDGGEVTYVGASEFAMVSLAWDGDALWTNDSRGTRIAAMTLPEV